MLPKCKAAVDAAAAAAGRKKPTEKQYQQIQDEITSQMNRLARADTARWQTLTRDQQLQEGAAAVMADIKAAADRKLENAQRQIVRNAETGERITMLQDAADSTRADGFKRDMVNTHTMIAAERKIAMGGVMKLIEAAGDKKGAGLGRRFLMTVFDAENPAMTRDIVKEIFKNADGHTGNEAAKAAARAWLDTIEGLRTRFNSAGGDVGKLEYGYVPQPHDTARVRKAGADAWVAKTMPLLDRSRYLAADGARMTDDALKAFLGEAYKTLSKNGLNKQEPGAFHGTGARANRGGDERQIHFSDGDAWAAYMRDFGKGSIYDAMMGHIGGMTRDIGLVERYGPDANANARLQYDLAAHADGTDPKKLVGALEINPQTYWDMITGKTGSPVDETLAQTFSMLRNLQTAAKLGGAVISSVTDLGTLLLTTGYHKLPYWRLIQDIGSQASKETRDFMSTHGMIAESIASALNRWSGDNLGANWSGKLANSVLKLSLLNAWTDGLRQGFTLTMNAGMARWAKTEWSALSAFDREKLLRAGLTEADWKVLNTVKPTEFKGRELLTPQSILESDISVARAEDLQRISDRIHEQTAELSSRNEQDRAWIQGRIDKFDAARDALNRKVKERHAKRLDKNEDATEPLLQRMALLDAQREGAKLQADMEADFNRFRTQDDVRTFLNAVEDGRSADLADVQGAKPAVRGGLESAEAVGRRYGEEKGRLERRMQEIQNKIGEMDRKAGREADADAKAAQKKADEMGAELKEFIERSQDRQARRAAVIKRLEDSEAPRRAAEALAIKREIAAKVFGFIHDESEYAVLNPDMATRAVTTFGGTQAGTWSGEIARTVMQFKSFPIAMMTRHWDRMINGPMRGETRGAQLVNRSMYGFAAMATLIGLGAVAVQSKQVLQGKDPIDMSKPRFWMKALAQGGGLSVAGDLFLIDPASSSTDSATTAIKNLAGPTVGTVADLALKNITENVWQAAEGKDTHWEAELAAWAKAQTPGANLWWLKPMVDHGVTNALNESMSPGYLSRMQQRGQKDFGQRYWWAPRDTLPQRAPDLSAAMP